MEAKRHHEAKEPHVLDDYVAGETREETPGDSAPSAKRPLPWGLIAFAIAVILVIAEAIAINLATSGQPLAATAIGQTLVVLTAVPLALGLFVALRGPRREWGIAAMVVAVIANPLILLNVLSFFGTL